ncbi:UNVERIFIED_CONTAM: hypothetical protein K2H54_033744 [Gekko kuhli]
MKAERAHCLARWISTSKNMTIERPSPLASFPAYVASGLLSPSPLQMEHVQPVHIWGKATPIKVLPVMKLATLFHSRIFVRSIWIGRTAVLHCHFFLLLPDP